MIFSTLSRVPPASQVDADPGADDDSDCAIHLAGDVSGLRLGGASSRSHSEHWISLAGRRESRSKPVGESSQRARRPGRGGAHQVDVLGELAWIPAFTFPLRLIVEAKARSATTGIGEVRNAVGVVTDVNQNLPAGGVLAQRFSYRYALFSVSGFSAPAARYALAHQISLVDLSGEGFADIVELAEAVTSILWTDGPLTRGGGLLGEFRARMRETLGTWPTGVDPSAKAEGSEFASRWRGMEAILWPRIQAIGELFVGMANGPYLLLLRAPDPARAIEVLERDPVQDVSITWSPAVQDGTQWTIALSGYGEPLELTFALPDTVAAWIFDPDADAPRRAMQFKEQLLSTITIYRFTGGRDRLYRLRFSPEQAAGVWRKRRDRT